MTTKLPLVSQQRKALENCAYCPKLCRAVCPVSAADRRETLTPWGKMSLTWMTSRGRPSPDAEIAETVWACTGCMACRQNCDHENPVAETLAMARADYFNAVLAPSSAKESAARFPELEGKLSAAAQGLAKHDGVDVNSRIALVVGCSYLTQAPEESAAALRVAASLVGPIRLVDACCGLPLFLAGDHGSLRQAQKKLERALSGTTRVIAADPGCTRFLESRRAESLVAIAARSLSKLRRLEDLKPDVPVRYHDPCQLGRGLGLFEEPRKILARILGRAPEEFSRAREDAVCSGGGGLLPETAPRTSERIASQRLEDHRALGGGIVVTACGKSLQRFRDNGAEAVDLLTLVDRALPR